MTAVSGACKVGRGKGLTQDESMFVWVFKGLECSSKSRMCFLFLADNFLVFLHSIILFSVTGIFFFFFNFPKASEVLSSYQWPFFSCSDSERTIQEFNNVQDWYLFFLIDPCLSVENSSFVAVEESFLSKHELMMSCVLIKVFDLFLLFLLLSFHLVWEMKDFFFFHSNCVSMFC